MRAWHARAPRWRRPPGGACGRVRTEHISLDPSFVCACEVQFWAARSLHGRRCSLPLAGLARSVAGAARPFNLPFCDLACVFSRPKPPTPPHFADMATATTARQLSGATLPASGARAIAPRPAGEWSKLKRLSDRPSAAVAGPPLSPAAVPIRRDLHTATALTFPTAAAFSSHCSFAARMPCSRRVSAPPGRPCRTPRAPQRRPCRHRQCGGGNRGAPHHQRDLQNGPQAAVRPGAEDRGDRQGAGQLVSLWDLG